MLPHIEEGARRFFYENGAIFFEHFLSDEKNQLLLQEVTKNPIEGFLQSAKLKNILTKIHLGKCLNQLLKEKVYLLGISRVLQEEKKSITTSEYSVHPIECFIYFQLEGLASFPFSMQSKSILFISVNQPFDLEMVGTGLLIGVGALNSRYILNPDDSYTHLLKKYGYGFGDRLNSSFHPHLK